VLTWDWDVESYYPSLAIANGLYPEHLGEAFVKVYADMKNDRTSFKKGTQLTAHPLERIFSLIDYLTLEGDECLLKRRRFKLIIFK
jgi:hypothetical protein